MLTAPLMLLAFVWSPILLYQLVQRPFRLLLVWLIIAPAATNFVAQIGAGTVSFSPGTYEELSTERWQEATTTGKWTDATYYANHAATVTFFDILEPTRTFFGLLLVVYLLGGLLQQKRLLPLDRTETWMSVFSLIVVASVLLRSWRFAFGMHVAVDAFIVPFLGYYLARRLVTSEDRFRQLTRAIGYMGFYVIVMVLIERLTHPDLIYRVQGPFDNRDNLYVVMAVVFFTVLADSFYNRGLPEEKQTLPRIVQLFVIYLSPIVVLLTLTRGNWVGFFTSVWVFLFLGRRLINLSRKVAVMGLTLILIPVIAIGLSLLVPKEIFEKRISNIQNVQGRFATWKATIKLSGEAPIFGVGLNNLRGLLGEQKTRFGETKHFSTPHNSFLTIFAELGATGLLAHVLITVSILQMGLSLYLMGTHSWDWWRGITVIAIMVAYHVPSLFEHLLYHTELLHVYVYVFMGAIAGLYGRSRSVPELCVSSGHYRRMSIDMSAVTR